MIQDHLVRANERRIACHNLEADYPPRHRMGCLYGGKLPTRSSLGVPHLQEETEIVADGPLGRWPNTARPLKPSDGPGATAHCPPAVAADTAPPASFERGHDNRFLEPVRRVRSTVPDARLLALGRCLVPGIAGRCTVSVYPVAGEPGACRTRWEKSVGRFRRAAGRPGAPRCMRSSASCTAGA